MIFYTYDDFINYKKKYIVNHIQICNQFEYTETFSDIIKSMPKLKKIDIILDNIFDNTIIKLIDDLCVSDINYIKIKINKSSLVWFNKDYKCYNHNSSKTKKIWTSLSIYDFNRNFNYDNLPMGIDKLHIYSSDKLNLTNLPINLKKLEISFNLANAILGYKNWKIPFNCELYFNNKLIET